MNRYCFDIEMLLLTSFDSNEAKHKGRRKSNQHQLVVLVNPDAECMNDRKTKSMTFHFMCSLSFPVIFHMKSQTFVQLIPTTDILIIIYDRSWWLS